MQTLNRETVSTNQLPIKVLQFGEGNFLRAFADWIIDIMNEQGGYNHGIAVVQPIEHGIVDMLDKQDGLYHHVIRGLKDGQASSETKLIKSVQKAFNPFKDEATYWEIATSEDLKIVISNTTEAGIVFKEDDTKPASGLAVTFPGKVTQLLWERYQAFEGSADSGLTFIPVELIDKNGQKLKEAILSYAELWQLPAEFSSWVETHNNFANTLVDRIVPGYPKEEIDEIQANIGFSDNLVVASEIFHLWVIEGSDKIQKAFPANEYGLNVIFTDNQAPYRTRKVRVLNGSHTSMVPVGLLHGLETVSESVEDETVGAFIKQIIFEEILPTIDLPQNELEEFANQVIERFKNPFIRHELKSISLNSISKFKVRVLPTILDYIEAKGQLPIGLVSAFSHLIKLYLSDSFEINDDADVKAYFEAFKANPVSHEELITKVLSNDAFWGQDLTAVTGLKELMIAQAEALADGARIDQLLAISV